MIQQSKTCGDEKITVECLCGDSAFGGSVADRLYPQGNLCDKRTEGGNG